MWPQGSSRGHRGQKFVFTKSVSTPLYYSWLSCHSYTWRSLTLSFKIINMNLTWGHLESLRSKNGVKFWTILNGKTKHCKSVGQGQTSKSVHSDLFTWPTVKGSKVKSKTTWNDKSNPVNVLILVKHQKKSMVTSSSNLRIRDQRSKKVKSQTTSNDKSSTVNVFIFAKHQKMYTVTSSCDQQLRVLASGIHEKCL